MQKSYNDSKSFFDRVKESSDIVSVISRYVPLKKQGSQFFACCPFHHEKTPSFAIHESGQYYHCFGCGETGDVFKFVQKIEGCDFLKAVEILAKSSGIEMPDNIFDEKISKQKKQKELFYKINKEAAKFYNKTLFSGPGQEAYNYLTKRGISRKTIIQFGLGYSPNFNALPEVLKQKGFKEQEMLDCGVVAEKNKQIYDFFAERIIFPIINTYGDIVGFSGRTLKKDEHIAKYKNSRENTLEGEEPVDARMALDKTLFNKGGTVFALNLIKKQKQEKEIKELILVEGQIDVLKMHEAGFTNAVAAMGTAFTSNHAKELKRFCGSVVVCMDGDTAGQKAQLKTIDILQDAGLYVRAVLLPDKLDPDDFLIQYGSAAFAKLISEAMPGTDYKIADLARKTDFNNNYEKAKFVKDALEVLRSRKNEIESEVYIKLIYEYSGVSIDVLRRQLNTVVSEKTSEEKEEQKPNIVLQGGYVTAVKFVLAAVLHKQPYADTVTLEDIVLPDKDLQKLLQLAKKGVIISTLFDEFDIDNSPIMKEIINYNFVEIKDPERLFKDSVNKIHLAKLEADLRERNHAFKQAKDESSQRDISNEIMQIIIEISKRKNL